MKKYNLFLPLCIVIHLTVSASKAPRPGAPAAEATNAIAAFNSGSLVPVMEMLAQIMNIVSTTQETENSNYTIAQKTLQEVQEQNGLLLQQIGFDTLTLAQQETILTLLQQAQSQTGDEATQLSFNALSLAQQEEILAAVRALELPDTQESLQLLITILSLTLAQQQEIETLQTQQTEQFESLQTLLESAVAQLTLQQGQLQQIIADIAALTP